MIKAAEDFKALLNKHFVIDDWEGVDILLAAVLSHKTKHTEMLWLRLIGASGTGKTELLRAVGQVEYAATAEHLTPAAIRGGYVPRSKGNKKLGPLFLERVNGKLLITKEFASILTSRKEDRTQVLGLLRSVYDGTLDSEFGGEQRYLHQTTQFDWIIGTTAYVDQQRQLESQLGSRFIDLRWKTPENGKLLAQKAIDNDPQLGNIRQQLGETIRYLAKVAEPTDAPTEVEYITELAVFTATYRTPLQRDSRTREIMEVPALESPARIGQALARLRSGLVMLGIDNTEPYLLRVALDTLPKTRASYVKAIVDGVRGREELSVACGVSTGAISYITQEMRMLGFDENTPIAIFNNACVT